MEAGVMRKFFKIKFSTYPNVDPGGWCVDVALGNRRLTLAYFGTVEYQKRNGSCPFELQIGDRIFRFGEGSKWAIDQEKST